MAESIDDLLRNYFANHGKTDENEHLPYSPLSSDDSSEDSIVTLGLEFSRIWEYDDEYDDFAGNAQTRNISTGEMSFLSDSVACPEKESRQLISSQKPGKSAFASSGNIKASPDCSKFPRVLMSLCFVLTLGIISPSPLSYAEDVSAKREEKIKTSLVEKRNLHNEKGNEAIVAIEKTVSYLLD